MTKYKLISLTFGVLVICLPPASLAQSTSEPQSSRNRLALEEVVVIAQKREENLQDVPISISAFSGDALDARGIGSPEDLTFVTPGLQYGSLAAYPLIYLRGIGSDTFSPTADSSVATYIDGVYFPFLHGLAQSFGAVERLEVLKGPQGTLFGRNSTGGAINIITKKPNAEPEVDLLLEARNFDTLKARLYASTPLTDTFAASISIIDNRSDSYYNFANDSDVKEVQTNTDKGLRLKLFWYPSDSFDISLNLLSLDNEGVSTTLFVQREPSLLGAVGGSEAIMNDWEASLNAEPYNKVSIDVQSLDINWDLSWFTAKSITSMQELLTDAQIDFDGSNANIVQFDAIQFADVITQEFQLISNESAPAWLQWVAGLYYIESEAGYDPVNLYAFNPQVTLESLFNMLPVNPLPAGITPDVDAGFQIYGIVDTESYATFGQLTADISEKISVTVGGRYQYEERIINKASTSLLQADGTTYPLFTHPQDTLESENFSPKFTVNYTPTNNLLLYMTWTKGFKSGTFNAININETPDAVQPEEVTSYELGAKWDLFNERVRLNGAIFENQIDNLHALLVSLQSGGAVNLENAAQARIRGADFDLTLAATPQLMILLSGAYLDGEYLSYPNASGFDEESGLYFSDGDFSGNTTSRSPKVTANIGLNYSLELGAGSLELATDGYYNSGYYHDAQNRLEEDEHVLYNAHASYHYEPWDLRLTMFGKNLGNEYVNYVQYQNDFGRLESAASPRVYGLRLNWQY